MIRRRRRGRYGRNPTPVKVQHTPKISALIPEPKENEPPIYLENYEIEVLRLTDFENLTQEEAGQKMGVSRGTIYRIQKRARIKLITAILEGRRIEIRESNQIS